MLTPLFVLSDVRYGGWISFTEHLAGVLAQAGARPVIIRVKTRTSNAPKFFTAGVTCRYLSTLDALQVARRARGFVTCVDKSAPPGALETLVSAGAVPVHHDPNDGEWLNAPVHAKGKRSIVIRRSQVAWVRERGGDPLFLRHPYVPRLLPAQPRRYHAISLSRVDWDKHTEILCAANGLLPLERRIRIYGALNRLYAHHKLPAGWEAAYGGAFTDPLGLASNARWVVDMSRIKGDGGGTQYTFLEAWNAGAGLIVSKQWIQPGDDMIPGVNCLIADDAVELATLLSDEPPTERLLDGGTLSLMPHSGTRVARDYLNALQ